MSFAFSQWQAIETIKNQIVTKIDACFDQVNDSLTSQVGSPNITTRIHALTTLACTLAHLNDQEIQILNYIQSEKKCDCILKVSF